MPETVGQNLKRIRKERKLTLEQIAHATHIRLHYLQALEDDQPDVMPSEAQGRGFLRLYAGHLNLPAQPLLDAWPDQFVVEESEETQPKLESKPAPAAPPAEKVPAAIPEPAPSNVEEDSPTIPLKPASKDADTVPVPAAASDTSQEIFQRIGNALRQQRESLSLSTADIENHTHIRTHYIEDIESGRITDIPSPAQARGMLKNYAQFLSMNAEAVLLEYADGLQTRRLELANEKKPAPQQKSKSQGKGKSKTGPQIIPVGLRKWITPDMLVGVFAILLLVVIVIWGISQVTATRELAAEPTAPPISEVLLAEDNNALLSTPIIEEVESTRSPEENNGGNAAVNSEDPGFSEGSEAIPVLDSSPLQLYIVASQRSWVRVTTDDEIAFEGRVIPGNAYPYSAANKIDLLTGNGAGLKVYFNQNEVGILGEVGEVVSVSFTAAGMVVPTPQPTPTPTPTQITPTPTLGPTSENVLPTPTVTPFIP